MSKPDPFLFDPNNKRWLWRIVLAILFFLLLAWAVWLYFDWKVQQLLPMQTLNIKPSTLNIKPSTS